VLTGLPRFLFPCGFHSATYLTIFPSSIPLTFFILHFLPAVLQHRLQNVVQTARSTVESDVLQHCRGAQFLSFDLFVQAEQQH
jgi:hypothetical protein